ncbi:unnamed protein product [Discula destructiva]
MPSLNDLLKVIEHLSPDIIPTEAQWNALSKNVPDPKPRSFIDVYSIFSELEAATPRVRLIVVLACLKGDQKIDGDSETAQKLSDYAAATIAPCSRVQIGDGDDSTDTTEDYEDTAQRVREVAVYGLEILRICSEDNAARLSQDTILTLISFIDHAAAEGYPKPSTARKSSIAGQPCALQEFHPWVSAESSELAERVLATQRFASAPDTLAMTILQDYLCPLFSKSRPAAVTASGRKAEFQSEQDVSRGLRDETGEVKPWKYLDHRAIEAFRWAVHKASQPLVSQQWPMFIPVLLTLVDDSTTRVRYVGLSILCAFLRKFPDHILHATGLAQVIEDAVFPTLLFLPTITPEAESELLLAPAYHSLLMLARKTDLKVKSGPSASRTPRARLLDKMLRDGVFPAYSHVKEHAVIVRRLFCVAGILVREMGINSVKHLKDLIPMHCEVLTDPLAVAAPALLEEALQSLHRVFLTCWPRLAHEPYLGELATSLVSCFLHVHDDPESKGRLKLTNDRLVVLAQMLCIIGDTPDQTPLRDYIELSIAKEPLLKLLFKEP